MWGLLRLAPIIIQCRIKYRQKGKRNPLSKYPTPFTSAIAAAWPGQCDVLGFAYDPMFRLPSADHIEPEVQQIVVDNRPCSKCWECNCDAFQRFGHSMAKQSITETRCLAGKLQQTIIEHWNLTIRDFNNLVSTLKTNTSKLIGLQTTEIQTY